MQDFIVSCGNSVFNNQMTKSTLDEVINKVKTDSALKNTIETLRTITDKKKRNSHKTSNLPYFNLGTFKDNERTNTNFISSEFMIIDIDNLDDQQLEEVKNKLQNDNRVYIYFLSPSGNGYKVVYKFAEPITDSDKFSEIYKYYSALLGNDYGVETDHTSDPARACFFSYDPNIYVNENADSLEVIETEEEVNKIDLNNYPDWFRAGMALASLGERGRDYYQTLSSNHYGDSITEVNKKFDNLLKTASGKIGLPTLFDIAKRYGYDYGKADTQPTNNWRVNWVWINKVRGYRSKTRRDPTGILSLSR